MHTGHRAETLVFLDEAFCTALKFLGVVRCPPVAQVSFRIELPALRDRRDDIPLLVNHFVRKFSLQMNKRINRVAPAAMNLLQQQPWAGNVRELENAVERAMVVAQEPEIREQDFVFKSVATNGAPKSLEEMEKAHILRVLESVNWNQTRAAEVLDIDRVTLHHKLKKYGWSRAAVETR